MAASAETRRSCRKLWDITLGRTAIRESACIQQELEKRFELLCSGLGFYKSPSLAAAETLAALTGVPSPEKDFSLKISAQLHLDEVQSHELLLTYLQDAHQGARGEIEVSAASLWLCVAEPAGMVAIKVFINEEEQTLLQDEQGASELLQKVSRFYYEERLYILRLLLYILTFFQDDRHPNQAVFASCVQRLQPERILLKSCQDGLEAGLGAIEAGTSLPGITTVQCLRECCLQLELLFLFFTYFEMAPRHLLCLAQLFCRIRFGLAGFTASPVLAQRIGYFCVLILIGGIDPSQLFRCVRQECVNEHQVVKDQQMFKELDSVMVRLGIVSAHGPVLLAWAVLRHAALDDMGRAQTQHLGKTAIQLQTMHFLSDLLQDPGFSGTTNCTARTARGCIYDFLSCVLNLFHENSLGDTKHLMNLACEVLVDPNLAENFWDTDPMDGLGVLLQSACTWFPLQLTPLLHLLTSLVCNRSTAKRVYSFFSQLENFAEGVMTRPRGMDVTEDENVWRIRATRLLYPLGAGQTNLRMPAGTEGVLLESVPGLNQRIIWSFPYSGWTLCTCELEFTHHVVSTADILQQSERVRPIVELVRKVVSTDSSLAVALLPLTSRLYPLLQRLACVPNPPVGVVSSCLACLATLAPHNPHKVWIDVQHTGFLPTFMTCPTTLTRLLSGEGLHPGNFGQFLVSYERPQGEFKVTLSFLKLVSALAKGLLSTAQGSGLGPCFVFILREIFPRFLKWNYLHPDERLSIGRVCLDLLHHVLNCGSHDTSDTGLHSLCLNALLHTEAGATLASLAAIGPSTLDAALSIQPSSLEGPGIQLVQQVKLALSLANNSLRLKPPGPLCALELALIHPQGVQACSVLAVLAQYVHHRFDPGLPRMAILLLKRLSTAAPMSVTACLGHKASAIRDAFVARLLEPTEDTRMKATILEFMAVSVETQPGLIELFLDLRAGDTGAGNDGKSGQSASTVGETEVANGTEKGVSVGKWSCVPAVLALVSGKGGGAKYVPPVLHCAALGFLHALWHDRRDGVTSLLRDRKEFWEDITFTLFKDFQPFTKELDMNILQACAFILKIVSLEIYYMQRPCTELCAVLNRLFELRRYEHWSMYMRDMAKGVASLECAGENVPEEVALFTAAWRTFLMLATTHGEVLCLSQPEQRRAMLADILAALQALASDGTGLSSLKLLPILTTSFLVLLHSWGESIPPSDEILPTLLTILEGLSDREISWLDRTHARLIAATTLVLTSAPLPVSDLPCLPALLRLACSVAQRHVSRLQHELRGLGPSSSAKANKDDSEEAMETEHQTNPSPDDPTGVCVASLCLVQAICNVHSNGEEAQSRGLGVVRDSGLLHSLLGALECALAYRVQLHFSLSALDLFLTVAASSQEQGADMLAAAGVASCICLPLLNTYKTDGDLTTPQLSSTGPANPSWESVYQLSLALLGMLLRKLRHRFLPHAFDFLGVHQDRVLQCLKAVRSAPFPPALSAALVETEQTVAFLQLVSCYSHDWRFHLPQLLSSVQMSLCYLCQTCTSLLHRPELLQHYLQAPRKGVVSAGGLYVVRAAEGRRAGELEKMRVSVGSSKEKEHGRGREREQAGRLGKECEQDAKGLAKVQSSLVRVLAWSLGTLRSFSPDISQLLLDTALEVWEFELLFTLTLSSPPFERDGAPSLGTLLTAVSLAHSLLAEADGRRDSSGSSYSMNMDQLRDLKPVLGFVAEAGLCLLASQALRVFKDPSFPLRDKQRLKRELGAELESLQSSALRQARRGSPVSPAKQFQSSPSSTSPSLPCPSPLSESRLGRPLSLPGPQGVHDSTFPLLLKLLICRVLC